MDFVLINESTVATSGAQYGGTLAQSALVQIAEACQIYLDRDVATYWGGAYRVRAASGPSDIVAGEIACAILDSLPNAPGAVAYHDVAGAEVPVVFLARDACNAILSGSDSISSALSHELAETAGDAACNLWIDDGQGSEWAHELCDAVQDWGYRINGVAVSDFVLPAFFAPGSVGPWNFGALIAGGNKLTAALQTAPGGYQIKRSAGSGETQVTGRTPPHARKCPARHVRRLGP